MIIIFTIKYDYSSTCVIKWLDHYGMDVLRINGDDDIYSFEGMNSHGMYFRNKITDKLINLMEATACWWRRTGITKNRFIDEFHNPCTNGVLEDLYNEYVNSECKALKTYIHETLYNTIPINLGTPYLFDCNRLTVLDMAKRLGFTVPRFEIVTNGKQLSDTRKTLGRGVTKAVNNGVHDNIDGNMYYSYTELLDDNFYNDNIDNTFFPSLITECIEKQYEIRTFFIDGQFFSMAIFSQSNEKTKVDFRKYADNRNVPYQLPKDIEDRLLLLFEELKLNTGSVDFIFDKDGNYVFLEINPVGQFGMTSEPCNYNLDNEVAKYLIYGKI